MNERIRELAEQARLGRGPEKIQIRENGVVIFYLDELEKFAELIVRECVKVMYDNAIERKVPPNINQIPTHYAIAVLEHFGVER